jgi:FSR family fosmidomycin resistance protein-like MFS transporter
MQFDTGDNKPVNKIQRKALLAACVAHVLHDGYTDQLYALLPILENERRMSVEQL